MATVTLTITDALLVKLGEWKDAHNAETGESLTMKQFVGRKLKFGYIGFRMAQLQLQLQGQTQDAIGVFTEQEETQMQAQLDQELSDLEGTL
jgi:hypothetical protein